MQKEDLILKKLEKLERIPEVVDVIVDRLDTLTDRIDRMEHQQDVIVVKVLEMDERLTRVDANVSKLNTDMYGAVETLDAHTHLLLRLDQERVASYATLERHGEAITALQKKTARA